MPVYKDVFDFSTETNTGFQATIQVLDNLKNPVNINSFSASMVLTVKNTSNIEFTWTTNDIISKSGAGNFVINIQPNTAFMPKTYVSVPDQYSYQIYDYVFDVKDGSGITYFTLTGSFTIYIT